MILVPNHQQPLNGSKFSWLLLLFLVIPIFHSCALFKKAEDSQSTTDTGDELDTIQGSKVFDPETGTYVILEDTPTEKMDTIIWKDIPENTYPPITSEGVYVESSSEGEVIRVDEIGSEFLTSYNVSLILPFLTDRFYIEDDEIYKNSHWALNFYGGVKMALDELRDEQLNLNINVVDSRASEQITQMLTRTNPDLLDANLIIGPYRRDNVRIIADFARQYQIPFVSPHSAASGLSFDNPFYIQVNPTLKVHCEAILRHALRTYRPEQIILVGRDTPSELARFNYFHEEYFRMIGTREADKLQEFIIADNSADLNDVDLMPFIELQDSTVFIIPSWSDEPFVYSFLRKIDLARDIDNKIVVYGMPQWMNYELVDFTYYEKLNVHVSSSSYLDPLSPEIQFFKRRFFNRYGVAPSDEAFLGYDVMLFFGRMLKKHGTKFQYSLDQELGQLLHTRFEFVQKVGPRRRGSREDYSIDQIENNFINILKFQDYQFQTAN